jgi:uncharacterized protein
MTIELLLLCLVSFFAGFIDSVVGGGGLLQTPAILVILPQYPVATLFGTTKIPSIAGTAFAGYQYAKNVNLDWRILSGILPAAFLGAVLGAFAITVIDSSQIKPVIFVLLLLVAVYTYSNKKFGLQVANDFSFRKQLTLGLVFGFSIGFYDGLIGPGTGTFLILCFIAILGNDFLHASAHAKYVNVATNLAAMMYFASTGHILYEYAVPMALFNLCGSYLGTKLALLKGNKFIRVFFLFVVFGTLLRFAYDVFWKH